VQLLLEEIISACLCYYFGHTASDLKKESNYLDYWWIFWVYLFLFYVTDMSNKRSKSDIVAARARIEQQTIIIEQAVVRQDVMVSPFDFMDHIFQENNWQSTYTCNTVYPRLVREFYANMKIDQINQMRSILKSKVHGQSITVDPKLTTKNSVNRRVSTVTVTVDTRPFGSVCLWPRGQMGRRNIWPRV
jgi:hypothetical protein